MNMKPPNYDDSLARLWARLLPYAAIIHLGIAIWTYSDPAVRRLIHDCSCFWHFFVLTIVRLQVLYSPSVFQNKEDAQLFNSIAGGGTTELVGSYVMSARDSSGLNVVARISRENTLPLFILLGVVVVGWGLWVTVGFALIYVARTACMLVTCGRCCA